MWVLQREISRINSSNLNKHHDYKSFLPSRCDNYANGYFLDKCYPGKKNKDKKERRSLVSKDTCILYKIKREPLLNENTWKLLVFCPLQRDFLSITLFCMRSYLNLLFLSLRKLLRLINIFYFYFSYNLELSTERLN